VQGGGGRGGGGGDSGKREKEAEQGREGERGEIVFKEGREGGIEGGKEGGARFCCSKRHVVVSRHFSSFATRYGI